MPGHEADSVWAGLPWIPVIPMKALIINCTLKASSEPSNAEALGAARALADRPLGAPEG